MIWLEQNNKMLNAKEAREMASNYKEDKFQREIEGIFRQIEECATHGEFEIHFDKYISKRAKELLREQGYKITYHTQYNDASTTIGW